MKKSVILLLVLMLSSIVSVAQKASLEARRARLHEVIDQVWEYALKTVPENATQIGDTRYNDQVSDISPEFYASDLEQRQKFLAALEYLDVEGFSEQEQLNRQLQMRSL